MNKTNNKLSKEILLPIESMSDMILLPFYLNHNRLHPAQKLERNTVNKIIDSSFSKVTTLFGNDLLDKVKIEPFSYHEIYRHIDFKQRNEPRSYLFSFDKDSYLSVFFQGFTFHYYYNEERDIVSGGVSLIWNKEKEFALDSVLDTVYLHNLVKYFLETSFLPMLPQSFLQFSFLNKNKNKLLKNTWNDFFESIYLKWKTLVDDKYQNNQNSFASYDFFYSLINPIFLALDFINALQIIISYDGQYNFLKPNKRSVEHEALNDFYLFYSFLFTYNESFRPDASRNNDKQKKSTQFEFNQLKIIFNSLLYFHTLNFLENINDIVNNINNYDFLVKNGGNSIGLVLNSILNSDKFMLSIKSKFFISNAEFKEIIYQILNNEDFILENIRNLNSDKFFSNSHFVSYANAENIIVVFNKDNITKESMSMVISQYQLGIIYFGSLNMEYEKISAFAQSTILGDFKNKNFAYRRMIKDLRVLEMDFYSNLYGIDSIKYIISGIERDFHLQSKITNLIKRIRTEDEAEKLVVERNSIATAFICALFVGIIWFIDQCFASLQTTDSGGDAPTSSAPYGTFYPGYHDTTISFPVIYGFVGLATFVILIITIILAYHCTKLYLTYHRTKNKGLQNLY